MKPKQISDVELAFPAHVIGTLLPTWDAIPVEFRERRSPWYRVVEDIFGGRFEGDVETVDGIDAKLAGRHLRACLSSYEPKHEHKIAGVAYLMSLWFKIVEKKSP